MDQYEQERQDKTRQDLDEDVGKRLTHLILRQLLILCRYANKDRVCTVELPEQHPIDEHAKHPIGPLADLHDGYQSTDAATGMDARV